MTDTDTTRVDLRAAARALLVGEETLVIDPRAGDRIIAIANAAEPVYAMDDDELELGGPNDANVTGGVKLIRLQGVLTPRGSWLSQLFGGGVGGLQGFRRDLREAIGSNDVESIVIDVHSPGGLIGLVPETAAELLAARDAGKRITAVCNTMMASAAYWIAAQADEVVITTSGFAGSIGVYMVHLDRSALNEAIGIKPTYVSAGRYKVEGHSDAPLDDVARDALQREVLDLYTMFVNDVAAGRGVEADAVRDGYGEGRVLNAKRAVEEGLADRVATIEDVVRELARTGRQGGRASRASGAQRRIRAQHDNPEPNASTLAEEVRARIEQVASLKPPTVKPPGGTTA